MDLMNGADSSHSIARTREYVGLLRTIWDWTDRRVGADGESFGGQFYRFTAAQINPFGRHPLARKRIPIYTSALRPTMARMGGEIVNRRAILIRKGVRTPWRTDWS